MTQGNHCTRSDEKHHCVRAASSDISGGRAAKARPGEGERPRSRPRRPSAPQSRGGGETDPPALHSRVQAAHPGRGRHRAGGAGGDRGPAPARGPVLLASGGLAAEPGGRDPAGPDAPAAWAQGHAHAAGRGECATVPGEPAPHRAPAQGRARDRRPKKVAALLGRSLPGPETP